MGRLSGCSCESVDSGSNSVYCAKYRNDDLIYDMTNTLVKLIFSLLVATTVPVVDAQTSAAAVPDPPNSVDFAVRSGR